jgi:hypothetical protein
LVPSKDSSREAEGCRPARAADRAFISCSNIKERGPDRVRACYETCFGSPCNSKPACSQRQTCPFTPYACCCICK